ncbi:MAG TPA: phosphatidate cytidylyltransferase [Acidimicrobiales bacterium]|jgi:phosphatidate cytidylyltransferase|nr:phosphatidate cytidylyltransferase [Acidimicrobiales bacterium]
MSDERRPEGDEADSAAKPDVQEREAEHDTPGEDPADVAGVHIAGDEGPALRFGADDTGPLPHWTEPPTGEVPQVLGEQDPSNDLDVWSSFASQAPVWRDEGSESEAVDFTPLAQDAVREQEEEPLESLFEESPPTVRIGDASGDQPRVTPIRTSGGATAATRPRPVPRHEVPAHPQGAGRDMPTAVAVGLGLGAVYVGLANIGPKALVGLVVVVLVLGAIEFFDKVREKGYQPATLVGLIAAAAMPIAAYWRLEQGVLLVGFLAVVLTCLTMLLAGGPETGPLPNMAITIFGLVYVGVLGSFAALILRLEDTGGVSFGGIGILTAVLIGVVANDVGALFLGRSTGRTPVAEWISPNKTWEGVVGGAIVTAIALALTKVFGLSPYDGSWSKMFLLMAVVIILTPIGDFTESLIKRNLDIKDFGTLLPGHGGMLDRFDGLLFVLPAAYYLSLVVEPWNA